MTEKLNVLVVDDSCLIVDLCREVLETEGYPVTTAYSGEEALEKAKEAKFDVAFVDIVMLDMDGVETFTALKKVNPKIHVVMMTGTPEDKKIKEVMRRGAVDILPKPFIPSEILNAINEVEKKRKLQDGKRGN